MAVYQDKAVERIKSQLRHITSVIDRAKKAHTKEADTRTIVVDILSDMLGWAKYDDGSKPYITAEYAIKGGYADYVIVKKDSKGNARVHAVIEIKQMGMSLNESHIRQARDYAINEGVQWIIVTNGDDWQVYRIDIDRRKTPLVPEIYHVFSITLSNTDIRPGERAEWFYLLSEEAARKDELEDWYSMRRALSPDNLAKKLLSKEVIDRVRLSIKKDIGVNFPNHEIAHIIADEVINSNVGLTNTGYWIRKASEQSQERGKTNDGQLPKRDDETAEDIPDANDELVDLSAITESTSGSYMA